MLPEKGGSMIAVITVYKVTELFYMTGNELLFLFSVDGNRVEEACELLFFTLI